MRHVKRMFLFVLFFLAAGMFAKSNVYAIDYSGQYEEAEAAILEAWESQETELDVTDMGLTYEMITDFYQWMVCRYPEHFYVGKRFGMTKSGNAANSPLLTLEMEYKYSSAKIKSMKAKLDKTVKRILKDVDPAWSDMDKALYLHEYLCLNCEYDSTLTKATIYDCLVGKKAMCQGYAMAYQYLLEQMDVSCECVKSDMLNHMWNMLKIGKKYYMVDVTWDDPVTDRPGRAKHNFFLKSYAYFMSDGKHNATDWAAFGPAGVSKASAKGLDTCSWNKIDTPFCRIGNAWYAFDGGKAISRYVIQKNKLKKSKKLLTISDTWYVWGDSRSYYQDKYVSVAVYKNKLYYSTPQSVCCLNVKNGKTKVVYRLSASQKKKGYIYAMTVTPQGKLKLLLGTSINNPTGTVTAKSL